MIWALVQAIKGVWMAKRSRPSTPALVARLANWAKAAIYSGPAVGIAAVVDGVDAEENVGRANHLGKGQGQAEEHGVPRGHVGHGDAVGHLAGVAVLGHFDVGRQGAAAEAVQFDGRLDVAADAHGPGDPPGRLQFEAVPLAVVDRQGVERKALRAGRSRRWWPSRAPRKGGSPPAALACHAESVAVIPSPAFPHNAKLG